MSVSPPQVRDLRRTLAMAQPDGEQSTAVNQRALPPQPRVRGERLFVRVDAWLAWLDGFLSRWLPADYNPLAQSGAAANVALLVAVASGIALLIWYSPSLHFAYPSLVAIQGRTFGGFVRGLHRYSSDLTMLLLVVHAARVFVARKFVGPRWLPWISGVGMLGLIWFIGWLGYWLAWDQPAQQVATQSIRLLDTLPIFGEPLRRLFVSDQTVPSLLFFVVFFLHLLLPLAIGVGLAIHLARLSRVRLLPRAGLSLALVGGVAVAAFALPAPLDVRAQMTLKAAAFTVDGWFLAPLALALRLHDVGVWVALVVTVAASASVPWWLGRKRSEAGVQAQIEVSRCHACTQCVQDCPFDAIAMVPRTDGKRIAAQAQIDPLRCIGCGVCAGSCDSEGTSLPWFDTRVEEQRLERAIIAAIATRDARSLVFADAEIRAPLPTLAGFEVHRVPTASWLQPKFIERLFQLGVTRILIIRNARAEAWARDGGRWVEARLAGERAPRLRPERAAEGVWAVADFDPSRPRQLMSTAAELLRAKAPFTHERMASTPSRGWRPQIAAVLAAVAVVFAAAFPSALRVTNPASPEPELVVSVKALGARVAAPALDPAAEAAKPVHMRGVVVRSGRRAPVTVELTIDGVTERHVLTGKGVSHDGPATGEWRRPWAAGEHRISLTVLTGEGTAPAVWRGTVRATARRINVVRFEPATAFTVE